MSSTHLLPCVQSRLVGSRPGEASFLEVRMTRGKKKTPSPRLTPTEEEMAIRRAAKERIFAKYGLSSWQNAPDEALREYTDFLKTRTGGKQ